MVFFAVKAAAFLTVLTLRAVIGTVRFAWYRPWSFLACCAFLPILLALPEYIS